MTTQQRNSSDALYQRGFQYQTNPDYGHSKRPREKLLELPEDERETQHEVFGGPQ